MRPRNRRIGAVAAGLAVVATFAKAAWIEVRTDTGGDAGDSDAICAGKSHHGFLEPRAANMAHGSRHSGCRGRRYRRLDQGALRVSPNKARVRPHASLALSSR